MRTDLPIVELRGDGRQRGLTHGEELRFLITPAMERWRERIGTLTGMRPTEYVQQFLEASTLIADVAEASPDLYAEVLAIAEASGESADEIFAYNFMDEEWRFARAHAAGCSVIGFRAPGGIVLGQNMDLPESMYGSAAVLVVRPQDGPEAIVATAAGMIGLLGVNRAGVGCCVNTLGQLPGAFSGMPVAFIVREILSRSSRAEAGAYVSSVRHASGQHYAIGDRTGLDGYECSADGVAHHVVSEAVLVHTNHPLWVPDFEQYLPTPVELEVSGSRSRYNYLAVAVPEADAVADVEALLSSTEAGICVYPRAPKNARTFCSAVFELSDADPTVRVALGSPDVVVWSSVSW